MDCIIAIILLFLLMLLIRNEIVKRRDLKLIQEWLNEFNEVFEKCECFFGNEEVLQKKLEIYIGKNMRIIETTKETVEFLLDLGHDILLFEKQLIERYGEMNYNSSYYNFRKNLEHTQKVAASYMEN